MKTYFVDNTITQIDNALEHHKNNDWAFEFVDCVLEDAKVCINELRKAVEEKCDTAYVPGQVAYLIMNNKIYEGVCICSGNMYDRHHTEPMQYAAFDANIDGVHIKVKWYSDRTKLRPHKTREEAEDELKRKSTDI